MIIKEITLPSRPDLLTLSSQTNIQAPHTSVATTSSGNYLTDAIETANQSENARNLLLASWAPKTQQNYNTYYINWWIQHCGEINKKELFKASFADGNYEVIEAARSALSAIRPKQTTVTFGKDSNVSRRMPRGMFKLRSSLSKHVVTLNDPNIVSNIWTHFPRIKIYPIYHQNCSPKSYVPCSIFLVVTKPISTGKLKIDKLKIGKLILSHGTYFLLRYCIKNNKAGQSSTPGTDPAFVIRGGPNSEHVLSNLGKLLKRGKFFLTTQSFIVKRN